MEQPPARIEAVSPDPIVTIATGYMAAAQLFAASRIGLFPALVAGPATAAELADACGTPPRTTRILADTMASVGLLSRDGGDYDLTPPARAYLTQDSAELDLAPFLAFLEAISFPHWDAFGRTVDTDAAAPLDLAGPRWDTFLAGVMRYNDLHARMLVDRIDLSRYRTVLDLGGLAATFTIAEHAAAPHLRTTMVFDPASADAVRAQIGSAGLADAVVVEAAETTSARPAGPFDLVQLVHVIHRYDAVRNTEIFRHAREACHPGATLLVLDFFLDDLPQQRALDAWHAGEYLVIDGTVVHPLADVRSWLAESGWRAVDLVDLPGSPRVLVAEAV
ncbi:MAG TPA: methyltransferase dimerization domain-containing protein [Cellulomonas sp.]